MMIKYAKFSFLLCLVYLIWFKEAFFSIDVVLYAFVFLICIIVLFDIISTDKTIRFNNQGIVLAFFCLLLYSFITGVFIVSDLSVFISYIIRLTIFSLLCFCCDYICRKEQSVKWLFNIFEICGILCAIQTFLFGVSYNGGSVITMSTHNNPNKLGLTMVLGIMAIVFDKENLEHRFMTKLLLILLQLYIILFTGSRKSFLAALMLLFFWIFDYLQSTIRKKVTWKALLSFVVFIAFAIFSVWFIINHYSKTGIYVRMSNLFDTNRRLTLYDEAFEMWKSNPLFGVGYGQFQVYSRYNYYSHSTYAELISCTGIIGFIIIVYPLIKELFRGLSNLIRVFKDKALDYRERYNYRMMFLFLLVEVLLASGVILIYEIDHMLLLTVLFYEIDFSRKKVFSENKYMLKTVW